MNESRPKGRGFRQAVRRRFSGGLIHSLEGEAVPGDLWIEGTLIAAVSPPDPAPAWDDSEVEVHDARGAWILPGFVQVHVHLCQTLFRGAGEGRSLESWLRGVVWPLEAAHTVETIEAAALCGVRELLRGGTTAILDMGTTRHTEVIARVVSESGMRAFLGPALMDRGPVPSLQRPTREFFGDLDALAAAWHGHDDGRIRIALCPRFVPSVTGAFFEEIAARPEYARFPIHTHGSETRHEVEETRALTGETPPVYLSRLPGAQDRVKMAHGVWLDDRDREHLARAGAAVLHCPGSNFKLGSGLADILALRRAGIRVGLGADGAACNNRLDPWNEMRLAALIQSVLHGPDTVHPREILRLATIEGARALGLDEEIGSLRAGKRADFVIVDPAEDPASLAGVSALEDPVAALVFAGDPSWVRETWVHGRRCYPSMTAPEERADFVQRVRRAAATLAGRTGLPSPPEPTAGRQPSSSDRATGDG